MMRRFAVRLILAVLAVAAFVQPAHSQERKLEPVDEAAKDASWDDFRRQLLDAVEKRDRQYVLGVVSQNVRNGFGSPRGIAEFRRQWGFDSDDTPFWGALRSVLTLGSAWLVREKQRRELCAPYLLGKWPNDVDPTKHGVIVAREALVKTEPTSISGTLATLAYHIVPVDDWEVNDSDAGSKQKWVKIRVKEQEAFVPEEQIRSPIEHAACFIPTEHGWRLTVFGPAGLD